MMVPNGVCIWQTYLCVDWFEGSVLTRLLRVVNTDFLTTLVNNYYERGFVS